MAPKKEDLNLAYVILKEKKEIWEVVDIQE